MDIQLQRAWAPDELGGSSCAICEQPFVVESVRAVATWFDEGARGYVCPRCIEYLGQHPSGHFPTIEEYRDALRRFPTPIWASPEELERRDPQWLRTPQASYIARA